MSRILSFSTKRGVFFILLAMLIFSILNAIVKGATSQYNPIQLGFFRFFFAAIPAAGFLIVQRQWQGPSTAFEWKVHLKRAILLTIALPVLFMGIGTLPLSNSMALYFSSTLFVVGFSFPLLKEKVTFIQWLAVGLGFVGVLVIAKPDSGVFHWGALFVILGTLCESVFNLYGRLISNLNNSYMLTFLGCFFPSLLILFALPFVWVEPDFSGWISLVSLGIGGGLGQLCVTVAYRYAPAGVLAPMIYSAILWSILLDIVLYQNWPTESLFIGCGIIVASGLIIIFYGAKTPDERKEKKNLKIS